MDFFNLSNLHLCIAILISCINAVVMYFLSRKFLHVIQLGGYKISAYQNYLKDTKGEYIGRLAILSFLSIVS